MRLASMLAVIVAVFAFGTAAYAADIFLNERTIEFKIVEPCDVTFADAEMTLGWNDCEGAYGVFTMGDDSMPHPVSVLIYTGEPNWCEMDPHLYQSFFCNACCTKKRPDVYCMPVDVCGWYCYKTKFEYNCDVFYLYAYLPCNMALDVVDVY